MVQGANQVAFSLDNIGLAHFNSRGHSFSLQLGIPESIDSEEPTVSAGNGTFIEFGIAEKGSSGSLRHRIEGLSGLLGAADPDLAFQQIDKPVALRQRVKPGSALDLLNARKRKKGIQGFLVQMIERFKPPYLRMQHRVGPSGSSCKR